MRAGHGSAYGACGTTSQRPTQPHGLDAIDEIRDRILADLDSDCAAYAHSHPLP